MRITESNVSHWGLRPEDAAAPARAPRIAREREAPPATIASQVDSNPRDGWIDDYDLPYDQLVLLEQAREAAAAQAARQAPRVEARDVPEPAAEAPAQPPAARVDVTAPDTAPAGPRVDLLA